MDTDTTRHQAEGAEQDTAVVHYPRPGYYRRIQAEGDAHPIGERVYLLGLKEGRPYFVRHDTSWRCESEAEFLTLFEPDPDGRERYNAEVTARMASIEALTTALEQYQEQLGAYTPHLGVSGALEGSAIAAPALPAPSEAERMPAEESDTAPGTDSKANGAADGAAEGTPTGFPGAAPGDLVARVGDPALAARKQVAHIRNEVEKTRQHVLREQTALRAVLEEQQAILKAKVEGLEAFVQQAQEAIWTINLYLGADEEVVQIRDGAPAQADTPISLRQIVLYMDQECLVGSEDRGGMDFSDIAAFDQWLTADPAHLDQVLPEPKGVVVLKPRRTAKTYSEDPFANALLNQPNRVTYFLIRNGERLYRLWTSYQTGDVLIPRRDEFLAYFRSRRREHVRRADGSWIWEEREEVLEPGSHAYMEAEKKADAQRRHYLRMGLILQGLIDRTAIFQPLARPVRITDPAAHDQGLIQIITDADLALADGRLPYRDWLAQVNGRLGVGMRIVGAFNAYGFGLASYTDRDHGWGNSRLHPARAGLPREDAIYTIEKKHPDGGLSFLYERPEQDYVSADAPRARCTVYPSDDFILAIDAVTPAELHYYLSDRRHRDAYIKMVPVLKLALRILERETAEETPFVELLVGQVMAQTGVSLEDARATVPDLVRWWKFRNVRHRALVAESEDGARAIRNITAEYLRRRDAHVSRARAGDESLARAGALLLAERPDALLIAHVDGHTYAVLRPMNDEQIYTALEFWVVDPRTERPRPQGNRAEWKDWWLPDARLARWRPLHESERWGVWDRTARPDRSLTDPERLALVDELVLRLRQQLAGTTVDDVGRRQRGAPVPLEQVEPLLLAGGIDAREHVRLWYLAAEAMGRLPDVAASREGLLTSDNPPWAREPHLLCMEAAWQRVGAARTAALAHVEHHTYAFTASPWPWAVSYNQYGRTNSALLWERQDTIARLTTYMAGRERVRVAASRLRRVVERARDALATQRTAAAEAAAYAKFLAEDGDLDLWEGHRKTLRQLDIAHYYPGSVVTDLLAYLAERGEDLRGRLISELIQRYRQLGGPDPISVEHHNRRTLSIGDIPGDVLGLRLPDDLPAPPTIADLLAPSEMRGPDHW